MKRLMRLRASSHLRDLCAETQFNRAQLIQPFFVVEGLKDRGHTTLVLTSMHDTNNVPVEADGI